MDLGATRSAVLDVIADRGPVSVAAIADELGLHPNSVRDHLDHLLDSGHLRRVRAEVQGRGRPAWLYELAAAAQPGGSSAVVAALAAHLQATFPDPAREGRAAGRAHGRTQESDIPALMASFAPEDRGAGTLLLTRCPVLDAARAHPDVVCALHLGLVEGALEAAGRRDVTPELVPFAEERGCLLRLAGPR